MNEPNYIKIISKKLNLKEEQIKNVLELIKEDNTVPFIARYRKEKTQNLDEDKIRNIIDLQKKEEKLFKTKTTALNSIEEQNKLTKELKKSIIEAQTLKEVEDIYEPYKRKKKTKADIAFEKGFEIIANQIINQNEIQISTELLNKFEKEEIIEGAKDIVIQKIIDEPMTKKGYRFYFTKYGKLESKYTTGKKQENLSEKIKSQNYKFKIYNEFKKEVALLKSYQILAINRGENYNLLKVNILKDEIPYEDLITRYILKNKNKELLIECLKEANKKIFISIEKEVRNELTKRAEIESIKIFQENLEKVLMLKPQYKKSVLGIDPAFRTGCKIAYIDENNKPLEFSKIFLEKKDLAKQIINNFLNKYSPNFIVIGNGTASNETKDFLQGFSKIPIIIVNESGASVYSASSIGKDEFPTLDLTDRGTISIARRFIDPLSEFVKVPVESIGVGMYQHDINQKDLKEKLEIVVENVVNKVGINLNSASVYVLNYISGLNKKTAKKLVENAPYNSRAELKKILSKKTFEQAVGFLRIQESTEELDNTNIHPEQYKLTKYIIKNKITETNFNSKIEELKKLYLDINENTISDIIRAIEKKGFDPRINDATLQIEKTITINDIKEGDQVKGIIRNVMQFGAFVDIGLKNDGLIHISELANKFIKEPKEVVEVGEEVLVKIIGIDIKTGKIQLSLKQVKF